MIDLTPLREALAAAERDAEALRSRATEAGRAWDVQSATLGREPAVPAEPREPVPPPQSRPAPEAVTAARALLDDVRVNRDRRDRWELDHAAAERENAAAQAAHVVASDRADLVSAHLAAARRAPADCLRGQIGALGDLGPVVLEVPERTDDTPRTAPWVTLGFRHEDGTVAPIAETGGASTGERAVASLWLQMGLRRAAAGLDKLWARVPVVADLSHCHGAPTPPLRGIVWLEAGAPVGEPLTVRA